MTEKTGTTSKRTNLFDLKATFDSDESDWSDNEEESAPAKDNEEKIETNVSKEQPEAQVLSAGKVEQSLYSNYDFGQDYSSGYTYNSHDSVSKQRNSIQKDVSPAFLVGDKVNITSLGSFANVAREKITRQETFNVSNDEETDDWDEESCAVNFKPTGESAQPKVSRKESPTEINTRKFLDEMKGNLIDWSETYSDGEASEVPEDEGFVTVSKEDNKDAHESKDEPTSVRSRAYEVNEHTSQEESRENDECPPMEEEAGSTEKITNDIDIIDEPFIEEKVIQRHHSKSSTPDDRTSIETKIVQDDDEQIESAVVPQVSKSENMATSSSAAQLFCVAPSNEDTQRVPSAFNLSQAPGNQFLVNEAKNGKKSKPSSAKQFISRLFSSDHDKSTDRLNSAEVPRKPVRKNSEPLPLSTLLLNLPLTSSQSEGELIDAQVPESRSVPSAAARYFPPPYSQNIEVDKGAAGDNPQLDHASTVPKKRKGLFGKMKKTLGISSKSSKMKGSESMKNLPLVATTSVTTVCSDPGPSSSVNRNLVPDKMHAVHIGSDQIGTRLVGIGQEDAQIEVERPKSFNSLTEIRNYIRALSSSNSATCTSLVDDQNYEQDSGKFGRDKMMSTNRPYCAQAKECCQNRQVIYNLLDDLCCVLDKTFGQHDQTKDNYGAMCQQCDELKGSLECGETTKRELERKIEQLQCELEKLQCCLEEEQQARMNLEDIVCELKCQIDRQDDALNCELNEKSHLLMKLKQLETDNLSLKNKICDFDSEREGFSKTCRGFEGTKNKCEELQAALAECCEKHDRMQKEIMVLRNENNEVKLKMDNVVFEKNKAINDILQNDVLSLKAENNDLKRQLDKCCYDKNKLLNDIENMKQAFCIEKTELERKICELLEGIDKLEKAKADVCKQTNIMLAAHHEEMDKLQLNADNYRMQLEEEIKKNQELRSQMRPPCSGYRQSPQSPGFSSGSPSPSPPLPGYQSRPPSQPSPTSNAGSPPRPGSSRHC